jgi:predicted murein hydrolase (TIGR00659 family)
MNSLSFLSFFVTVALYASAKWFYNQKPQIYFSPLVTVPTLLAILLLSAHISYDTYNSGAKWLNIMLQPATIAFAVPLYKYRTTLQKHAMEIIPSVLLGSVIAMISSAWIAEGLNIDKQLIGSLIPRSVTTPIAMDVSQLIGGVPSVTAVIVIMTGILGSVIGPFVIQFFKIESEIARGVLFGTSSHAVGTVRAFQFSATTGTVACVSMILAAIITITTVQLLIPVMI